MYGTKQYFLSISNTDPISIQEKSKQYPHPKKNLHPEMVKTDQYFEDYGGLIVHLHFLLKRSCCRSLFGGFAPGISVFHHFDVKFKLVFVSHVSLKEKV